MPISVETIKALVNASSGNSVLIVSKPKKKMICNLVMHVILEKLSIDCKINKSERTILINKGEISFVPFEQAGYFSKGRRAYVYFDEWLERDLNTFKSLIDCENSYKLFKWDLEDV